MKPRPIILILSLSACAANASAETDCSKFLVPGKEYEFKVVTTSGPVEKGRRQTHMLTAPETTKNGACTKVKGTYADSWAMTLTGCADKLTVLAMRQGEGNLTGEATCSGGVATGTLGYTDAVGQKFGYSVTITPQ